MDAVTFDWVRELWTTSRNDVPGGLAVAADAVYAVGIRSKNLDLFFTNIDDGAQQLRLTKHDPATGDVLALQTADCTGFFNIADVTHGRDVAVDAAGNLYVAGHARCQEMVIGFQGKEWSVNTELLGDAFVISFLPTLEPRWIETQESNAEDKAETIGVFGDTVYVAGHFNGSNLKLDGTTYLQNKGGFDVYVASYTTGGAPTGRVIGIGGGEDDGQPALTVDDAGNVYVTGYVRSNPGQVYDGQGSLAALQPAGGMADAFVIKLSPNLEVAWATVVGGPADDKGKGIAVSGDRVFVGGFTEGGMTVPGCCDLQPAGGKDAFVVVLDAATGTPVAGNLVGGPGTDRIYDLAVVPDTGRVWAAGSFSDTAQFDGFVLTSAGSRDAFAAAFDADANVTFVFAGEGDAVDEATAVVGAGATLYLAGTFESKPWTLAGTTLPGSGDEADAFLARATTSAP